jgi:hypothetical protein
MTAKQPPQTFAMDDDPFDSKMSDTMRIEEGKMFSDGIIHESEPFVNAPCPISRRPTVPIFPVSPTKNGGKL